MIKLILNFFLLFFFVRLDHSGTPTRHKRTHRMGKRETQSMLSFMARWPSDHLDSSTGLQRSEI